MAPQITDQPRNQTTGPGNTATFSVTAAGTPPLTYQWRKDGTAIAGATSSSYVTPATSSSDNGAQFTVVVSNAVASVTSDPATLTVASQSALTVNVQTFGATGNGSTDDTAAINSAIAALFSGATLFFPCGTYLTTSQLSIQIPNVTIDGGNCAVIRGAASGGNILVIGNGAFLGSYGPATALSQTANELSTSFSTVSSINVSPGDYVYLSQGGIDYSTDTAPGHPTNCDVSGCRGELLQVASVSGNSVTVTTAFHDTYDPVANAATVRKLVNPLAGITLKNITLDGRGTENYGLLMLGVVNSTVSGVTSQSVLYTALYGNSDFNLAWNNITVSGAGRSNGAAMSLWTQGNPSVNGATIANLNPGSVNAFGVELSGVANGKFSNITVDASGAYGRPFKTTASRYNTFDSLTVKNGVQADNGISLEYYSSHNTYNNCTVTNNGAGTGVANGNAGINSFGNFNQFNTFNNCTVAGNGNVQFYVSNYDALQLGKDSHTIINGGTFTGSDSSAPVIDVEGDSTLITATTISGPGTAGIYLGTPATNGCLNNNTFTPGTPLASAISANSNGDLGLGNILNNLTSNLPLGTCGLP